MTKIRQLLAKKLVSDCVINMIKERKQNQKFKTYSVSGRLPVGLHFDQINTFSAQNIEWQHKANRL